jgi:hypothetical protein
MAPTKSASQIEDDFAKGILRLQANWPSWSQTKRTSELQAVITKFSKDNGFPSYAVPIVGGDKLESGVSASYQFPSNSILINKALLDKAKKSLSNAEITTLAADIRHEVEHAKDARKVANLLANKLVEAKLPLTAENIVRASTAEAKINYSNGKSEVITSKIAPEIAKLAVSDYTQGIRLKNNSPERKEAEQLRKASFTPEGIFKSSKESLDIINAKATGNRAAYEEAVRVHDLNPAEVGAERVEADMRQRVERIRSKTKTNIAPATNSSKSISSEKQTLTTPKIDSKADVSKVVALLQDNAAEVKNQYGLDVTTNEGLGKAVMQYWKENNLDPKILKEQLPNIKESEFATASATRMNDNTIETTKTTQRTI